MNDPVVGRLETKIVVILAEGLGAAEAANAAAVLALSASAESSDLGPAGIDAHGVDHGRIDRHPVPVLVSDQATLARVHAESTQGDEPLHVVAFTEVARRARDYDAYLADLRTTAPEDNSYVGLLLRGPRRRVTRVTRRLRLYDGTGAAPA
ncbi:DUF2000 family protein [Umezawaea beigongshangensis]|uniref:DUF2000 family protein n=1 Tax=Umezawaea beigongshangensis TaxID=2780383 RepID=UPI0018F1BD12|nr:DUF2000 family protein [Umezawaea beigongshangensis]